MTDQTHDSKRGDLTSTSGPEARHGPSSDDPALPVEGRVVSWLERTTDGAIVMGDLCLPGNYTLVACPDDESNPNELLGDEIAGTHVGSFHAPEDKSLSHTIPSEPGIYLLVESR